MFMLVTISIKTVKIIKDIHEYHTWKYGMYSKVKWATVLCSTKFTCCGSKLVNVCSNSACPISYSYTATSYSRLKPFRLQSDDRKRFASLANWAGAHSLNSGVWITSDKHACNMCSSLWHIRCISSKREGGACGCVLLQLNVCFSLQEWRQNFLSASVYDPTEYLSFDWSIAPLLKGTWLAMSFCKHACLGWPTVISISQNSI